MQAGGAGSAHQHGLSGGADGRESPLPPKRKRRVTVSLCVFCLAGARCGRVVGDDDPYAQRNDFHKNVIARSAATWQSVPLMWCCAGEYGLPHQCAHWFAMTRVFEGAVGGGGGVWAPRPTEAGRGGAMRAGRRGNRRSAAGGGRSEPVSRKCPDWRPRQWTGIGWHDGGQSPPPTKTAMCLVPRRCGCGA